VTVTERLTGRGYALRPLWRRAAAANRTDGAGLVRRADRDRDHRGVPV